MSTSRPYVIGLTGNIATGKSTVARMLQHLGAEILDADHLAHELLRPETETHAQVVRAFGSYVLTAGGEIDRSRLGRIVFGNPSALALLESLTHPAVIAETLRRIEQSESAVLCVEAIKLLEAGMAATCDAVWVVTSTRARQIERLMAQRGMSRDLAEQRIDVQPDPALKLAQADVRIDNDGALEATWGQVLAAWDRIPCVARIDPATPCPLPLGD